MSTAEFRPGVAQTLESIVATVAGLRDRKRIGQGCLRVVNLGVPGPQKIPLLTIIRFDRKSEWVARPEQDSYAVGSLTLESHDLGPTDLEGVTRLHQYIGSRLSASEGVHRVYYAQRSTGRTQWGESPCWYIETGDHVNNIEGHLPGGPFLIPKAGLVFERLADLAAWWTGQYSYDPNLRQRHGLVVPDYRAYFTSIIVAHSALKVRIHRETEDSLHVAIRGIDLFDREWTTHQKMRGKSTTIRLDRVLKSARIYLLGEHEDEAYDEHKEPYFRGLDGDVLIGARTQRSVESIEVEELLKLGEGPSVEFKYWTSLDHKRITELGETVVAFANALGGAILLGVDDYGDVQGTDLLVRTHTKAGATDEAREQVAQFLGKQLALLIRPRVQPRFTWIERGEHQILRIAIPPQRAERCFIEAKKESFVRRGATNERLTPWDAAAFSANQVGLASTGRTDKGTVGFF